MKKAISTEVKYINIEYLVEEELQLSLGKIKKISTSLTKKDILGGLGIRLNINRNNYAIEPGLYAIGSPDENSPVLVSANYKFTFDKLRKELVSLNLWLLIIDTKGINVWCAAGKGTFSEQIILKAMRATKLDKVVKNKTLILPQLAAPGVSAHTITKYTGFKVIYGPVAAVDIPEFLLKGYETTPNMRKVKFNIVDRAVLTPVETIQSIKYFPIVILLFLITNTISSNNLSFLEIFKLSMINSTPYLIAILLGTVMIPIFLPIIPFKSFALKGAIVGLILSILTIYFSSTFLFIDSLMVMVSNTLLLTSITTYLGLNFTGSSTYTSFSGVLKETIWAMPIVIVSSVIGVILMIVSSII
ncbi:acetyl-CoA synthase subunit gamma [Clostridium estertheticum]|nr:acetyl-CoA synthase subunit gamma [Clostridium estertheticum]